MPGQVNRDATLVNRNNDITSDHTLWIKEQIGKGTFITIHGREVWIKVPGRNLSRIVKVPESGSALYRKAWIDVYNYCLDYLEGAINAACLENRFIQRMGGVWTLNGHVVRWPKFQESTANYPRGLMEILEEYLYVKDKYIKSFKKESGIAVRKQSVRLKSDVSTDNQPSLKVVPKLEYDKPSAEKQKTDLNKTTKPKSIKKLVTTPKKGRAMVDDSFVIQKVSDGDLLDDNDIANLKNSNTEIVVLTCMNILNPKDEDIFMKNARKCHKAGLVTGAFVYSKAIDEHDIASELKVLLNMLSKFEDDFSGLVYYSINDEYVRKNRIKEDKILDFINMYNSVVATLKKAGYNTLVSMNLESGSIISEVCKNNNIKLMYDINYMVVVRDADEVPHGVSKIVIDPWNDYDVVYLSNSNLKNRIINRLK